LTCNIISEVIQDIEVTNIEVVFNDVEVGMKHEYKRGERFSLSFVSHQPSEKRFRATENIETKATSVV
jgi:hypothetical protein